MRTIFACAVCLAIGLFGGFLAGRRSAKQNPQVIVQTVPVPAPTQSRSRTVIPPAQSEEPPSAGAVQPHAVAPLAIGLPLEGLKLSDIQDTFNDARSGGSTRHEAIDIMAARGTPVHAVADGLIKKLFLSKAGGNTIYQFDPTGTYAYYYAHLDRYADNLREGMQVRRGDVIGYVGSTGDASPDAPHLHFTVMKLGPEKNWWQGTAVNPYALLVQAWRQRNG